MEGLRGSSGSYRQSGPAVHFGTSGNYLKLPVKNIAGPGEGPSDNVGTTERVAIM